MWHEATLEFFGLDQPWSVGRFAVYAALMYISALVIVRVGKSRFIGRATPFDLIVAFMLGSTLSRAVTGDAPFVPTIVAGLVIVGMHSLMSFIAFRSSRFSRVVKGHTDVLVQDGEIIWEHMAEHRITRGDLDEAIRGTGNRTRVEDVQLATFERNGDISIVSKPDRRDTPSERGRPHRRRHATGSKSMSS